MRKLLGPTDLLESNKDITFTMPVLSVRLKKILNVAPVACVASVYYLHPLQVFLIFHKLHNFLTMSNQALFYN